MVFTERVANWRPRLFTNVPRADDNDPNYARIRAKNFQSVEEPLVVNLQAVTVPAPIQAPIPQPPELPVHSIPNRPTESSVQPVQTPAPPVPLGAQPAPMTQTAIASAPQQEPTLDNTPFAGGIVLPGKPVDKKEDKFVEPGSTFTFGDDD